MGDQVDAIGLSPQLVVAGARRENTHAAAEGDLHPAGFILNSPGPE